MSEQSEARERAFQRQPVATMQHGGYMVTVDDEGVPDGVVSGPSPKIIRQYSQRLLADLLSCDGTTDGIQVLQHWVELAEDQNFVAGIVANALVELTAGNARISDAVRAESQRAALTLWEHDILTE